MNEVGFFFCLVSKWWNDFAFEVLAIVKQKPYQLEKTILLLLWCSFNNNGNYNMPKRIIKYNIILLLRTGAAFKLTGTNDSSSNMSEIIICACIVTVRATINDIAIYVNSTRSVFEVFDLILRHFHFIVAFDFGFVWATHS